MSTFASNKRKVGDVADFGFYDKFTLAAWIYPTAQDGAVVCRNWSGNGNTSFHFDKRLGVEGAPTDYRIASYIEDVR